MAASPLDPAPEDHPKAEPPSGIGMLRPPQAKVPFLRQLGELPRLARMNPGHLARLMRALAELALARVLLAHKTVRALGIPDPVIAASAPVEPRHEQDIAHISKAIAIVAPRVPWRSDCLVQCLAGRRWLASRGIEARITIGIKQDMAPDGSPVMLAHAWLMAGDIVVTGGDVSAFHAFPVSHT